MIKTQIEGKLIVFDVVYKMGDFMRLLSSPRKIHLFRNTCMVRVGEKTFIIMINNEFFGFNDSTLCRFKQARYRDCGKYVGQRNVVKTLKNK